MFISWQLLQTSLAFLYCLLVHKSIVTSGLRIEQAALLSRSIREVEYLDTLGVSLGHGNSKSMNWSPQWVEGPKGDLYIGPLGYITIHYEAVGVNKLMFKCNDRFVPTKNASTKIEKSSSGVTSISASLNVTREEVERQVTVFWCQCVGFTLDMLDGGNISSVPVNIHIATLRKDFPLEPMSKKVEVGTDLELKCVPPHGVPVPTIAWYKRDEQTPLDLNQGYGRKLSKGDRHYLIQNNRTLVIGSALFEDSGKFTCVASNPAGVRYSHVATVTVYRDGLWSGWSAWDECVVEGSSGSNCGKGVQVRSRSCDSPSPLNEGLPCIGEKFERSNCAIPCSDGSGWTPWSQWSSCQIPDGKAPTEQNCHQTRMRTCAINYGANKNLKGGKSLPTTCVGENKQTRSCSSELCQHILEESGGIMLTPASDLKRTQKDEDTLSTQLVLYMSFIIALITAVIIIVMIGLWMQRRRRRFLVGGTTLTLSSADDPSERKQSNARKTSSRAQNGTAVLLAGPEDSKHSCCCCYFGGGKESKVSRSGGPFSLLACGLCPRSGRSGRSVPPGKPDGTQQRHLMNEASICPTMACNNMMPSFRELPHTVSASSFYPNQTVGYNSCFSIDKCTPQNIVPSNSYHSLHAQMFGPRFVPHTQTQLFPHGSIAQCPINPLTSGVCRDSFYPLHNGDMYSESQQFFSRHQFEKVNSNSNRFQEAGLVLAGVPHSTYESPTQESGADYEDPNNVSSQQNDYYDYDYSLAGTRLQGSVSTTNINILPRDPPTSSKRHQSGGTSQAHLHRRSYCAAIDDKIDPVANAGGKVTRNLLNNSKSNGFQELMMQQPEDSGCGSISIGSFSDSPHAFDYNTARGLVGAAGGRISVPDFGASLILPPNSIEAGKKLELSLTVNTSTENLTQLQLNLLNGSIMGKHPVLSPLTFLASPIVSVGPADSPFSKPLTLTIPHFLFLRPLANLAEGVAVNTTDSDWTIAVIAIGSSDRPLGSSHSSSTSLHVKDNYQIHENFFSTGEDIHVITTSLAPSYCVVACPKLPTGNPGEYEVEGKLKQFAKRVRVAVFASQNSLSRKGSGKPRLGSNGRKNEDGVTIRVYCFPDLLEAWQSVLENEEVECDEKNALKNLITSQKLLPEHFTSMNLENGVFSAQPDKRSSQFVTGSGSSYGDVNNINLRLAMNECHPQQQVISLSSILSMHSMFQYVRFTHRPTFKSAYVNDEVYDVSSSMTSSASSSSINELFLNISRVVLPETKKSASTATNQKQMQQPLSHIIAIVLPSKEAPVKPPPCVFSPLMNADAPVFRIIGPLRQKVVQALNVNSSLSDCLLPTVFQPTGIQILAAKLGVYEVLNSQPNKASFASQGELVLNIWEVLGYKRTFMDEINQRRHFDTLLGTLGAIGRNDLKEEVNVRLMSP